MPFDAPPGRSKPASGVKIDPGQPTVLFVTVCAIRPAQWLATPAVHQALVRHWRAADAWLVGYYLLMPDHLHLFCAPRDLRFTVEKWIAFWKSQFSREQKNPQYIWQRSAFHHRLRSADEYREKWEYIRENPFRKGLVPAVGSPWPYSGELNPLRW